MIFGKGSIVMQLLKYWTCTQEVVSLWVRFLDVATTIIVS